MTLSDFHFFIERSLFIFPSVFFINLILFHFYLLFILLKHKPLLNLRVCLLLRLLLCCCCAVVVQLLGDELLRPLLRRLSCLVGHVVSALHSCMKVADSKSLCQAVRGGSRPRAVDRGGRLHY